MATNHHANPAAGNFMPAGHGRSAVQHRLLQDTGAGAIRHLGCLAKSGGEAERGATEQSNRDQSLDEAVAGRRSGRCER